MVLVLLTEWKTSVFIRTERARRTVPNTGQVTDDLDVELAEHLSITNARPLEDLGGAQGSGAYHNHLACLHDRLGKLAAVAAVARGDVGNADSLVVAVEDDTVDAGVSTKVEVGLDIHDAVNVC